eukprot:TRINITY_DN95271_c1_g2_i1.p1 TRINITY_DN95271_c1_g2~~TRINITY_DN95271_c1_g2_i1.p1  ORF type:complete len:156 (-),score=14.64 TRINITY_DN95271_c1_g2_i1:81-548(-)
MPFRFFLLLSRQGKVRLSKWYEVFASKDKARILREVTNLILARKPRMCNFIEYKDLKIVYKRYASLYFIACIDKDDNELIALETIHLYVVILDRYFGNVCELDLIYNFHKAYYALEELFMAGELQETSKMAALKHVAQQDILADSPEEKGKPVEL